MSATSNRYSFDHKTRWPLCVASLLFGFISLLNLHAAGQQAYEILHSFGVTSRGKVPFTTLVEGPDGRLYGGANQGGLFGKGTLYSLNKDGSGLMDFFDFPQATETYLFFGSDGRLYVTTTSDGTNGFGTIFRINTDGTSFEVLHRFGEIAGDGKNPFAPLMETDGMLWGTTAKGGTGSGGGTIFKLGLDGSGYEVVRRFNYYSTEAWEPAGALLYGGDGWFYGTAKSGGTNYVWGSVYRLLKDGSVLQTIHSFAGIANTGGHMPEGALVEDANGYLIGVAEEAIFRINRTGTYFQFFTIFGNTSGKGYGPRGGLVQGGDGEYFGTTQYGGNYGNGTLYRFKPTFGTVTWLVSFGTQERNPVAELLASSDGYLYGTTSEDYLGGPNRIFRLDSATTNKLTLAEFGASFSAEPYGPRNGVTESSDGSLFGNTISGGITNAGDFYRVNPTTAEHRSLRPLSAGGSSPAFVYGQLLLASDGYFYGTSVGGGSAANGTVFQVDSSGSRLQTLWQFVSPTTQGRQLYAGLIEGPDGYLYGTAFSGGQSNYGTAFRLTKSGTDFGVLHHFGSGSSDGRRPRAALLGDSDGWLYGTTSLGGNAGTGTVFRVQYGGANYQVLHHFGGAPFDGSSPYADLFRAMNGLLYGTCRDGGAYGDGIIFRLADDGTGFEVLHHFNNGRREGRYPQTRLLPAGNEGLYGVTSSGGLTNGTLFRIGLAGEHFVVLHHFGSLGSDGLEPSGLNLTQDGSLVGTTRLGGLWNRGSVFRVLPLLIEPLNASITDITLVNGKLNLQLQGRPLTSYHIEATSNLVAGPWYNLGNVAVTTQLGHAGFTDVSPVAPRYYRAVAP